MRRLLSLLGVLVFAVGLASGAAEGAATLAEHTGLLDRADSLFKEKARAVADLTATATSLAYGIDPQDRDFSLAQAAAQTTVEQNFIQHVPKVIKLVKGLKKGTQQAAKKTAKETAKKVAQKNAGKTAKTTPRKNAGKVESSVIKKSDDATQNLVTKETSSGFKGRRGFELENPQYQPSRNKPTVIGNRPYSGHALDQMQNRGIPHSVIEHIIKDVNPVKMSSGAKAFYDPINKIRVIVNSETGKVITLYFK